MWHNSQRPHRRSRRFGLGGLGCIALVLGACGGSDGTATDVSAPPPVTAADTPTETEPSAIDAATLPASTLPTTTTTAVTTLPATTLPATTLPATTLPATTTTVAPQPPLSGDDVRVAIENALASESGTASLTERMAELNVPGLAVAVVRDGEVITAFGAGSTPGGEPMSSSTISQVGSVSKPVAAIAAASLAADGTIGWETAIDELLLSYTLPAGEQTVDNPVTIGGLLSHTAGTSVDGFLGYPAADLVPDLPTVLAGEGASEQVAVVQPPGSGFLYSGGGYELVEQALLDVVGSTTFDDVVGERVFRVAGMPDSFYSLDPSDEQRARTTSGSINGVAMEQGWQRHPENAAAGLWTTADDLAALLVSFNASLSGVDESLLPQNWAQAIVTPVVDLPFADERRAAAGRGFFLDDPSEPSVYRHNGRNVGYTSEIAGTVDGRFGVVVVTNAFPGGTPLATEIIDTVADILEWTS